MKYLVIREDTNMVIKNVRLSYEHVFEPWAKEEGKPKKFSAVALIPKDTHAEEVKKLQEMMTNLQKTELKQRVAADKLCITDGDLSGKDEYAGMWVLKTSEKLRPTVLDRDGRTPIVASDDKVYSGCFINLMFRFWVQNNQHGKRINANLVGVQFKDHGEKFSNVQRPAADEMFDAEEGNEDDGFDE